MAEIKELRTRRQEVNESVVRILRECLDQAEQGLLTSVAIAATPPNSAAVYCGFSQGDDLYRLIGGLERIKTDLLNLPVRD